jgi:hypothetical protein
MQVVHSHHGIARFGGRRRASGSRCSHSILINPGRALDQAAWLSMEAW